MKTLFVRMKETINKINNRFTYFAIAAVILMEQFAFYLKQGIYHKTDLNGLDHKVFVIALCAVFTVKEWQCILVLIKAFTIGHTATLALSSLDMLRIQQQLIETLIPVTIFLRAIVQCFCKTCQQKRGASKLPFGTWVWFNPWNGILSFLSIHDEGHYRSVHCLSLVLI